MWMYESQLMTGGARAILGPLGPAEGLVSLFSLRPSPGHCPEPLQRNPLLSQSVIQSIRRPASQSVNQSIRVSLNQSACYPANQTDRLLVSAVSKYCSTNNKLPWQWKSRRRQSCRESKGKEQERGGENRENNRNTAFVSTPQHAVAALQVRVHVIGRHENCQTKKLPMTPLPPLAVITPVSVEILFA